MKVLTVKDLHSILETLVSLGEGDRVVLIPNAYDEDIDADYRTIGQVDTTHDIQNKYIYLESNSTAEENAYFDKLEGE